MSDPVEAEVIDEEEEQRPQKHLVRSSAVEAAPRDAQAVAVAAAAMQEVRSGMEMARAYPRNEDECRSKVIRQCQRKSLAAVAEYDFKHGRRIRGPSIQLLEQVARCWGNLYYGHRVLIDTDTDRTIDCYAYDLETGTRSSQQVNFKKMHLRKDDDGKSRWVPVYDERELRWLTNAHASVAIRNCLERVMPQDLVEDAAEECRQTKLKDAKKDPDAFLKGVIDGFAKLAPPVSAQELTNYLGHPIVDLKNNSEALVKMRGLWQALKEFETTWSQAVTQKAVDEGLVRKDSMLLKSAAELAKLRKKPKEKASGRKKQWTEEPRGADATAAAEPPSDRAGEEGNQFDDDKDVDDGTQEE